MENSTPLTVPRDNGKGFIDWNGRRMNGFTLLPLIWEIQAATTRKRKKVISKFDWPSVDFVADRGSLQKLVVWANNKHNIWRIDTQLAGEKTVLMNGWPPATKETMGLGYGINFEKACTHPAPGCESGVNHNRIVAYVRATYASRVNTSPDFQ